MSSCKNKSDELMIKEISQAICRKCDDKDCEYRDEGPDNKEKK